MRYFILIIVLFAMQVNVLGQSFPGFNYGYSAYYAGGKKDSLAKFKKECNATRIGKIVAIAGGAGIILGGAALLSGWAKAHDDGYGSSYKEATAVAVGGLSSAVIGGVLYLVGQDYDERKLRKFSVKSNGKSVGVIYHFR